MLPVRLDFSEFDRVALGARQQSNDWLYVGRLVGNKCQHELVAAFALYSRTFDDEARLVLIGDTSTEEYAALVRSEIDRYGVSDRVVLLGKISDRQLRSAFAGCRRLRVDERARGVWGPDPRGHGGGAPRGRLRGGRGARDDGGRRHPAAQQGSGTRCGHRPGVQSDEGLRRRLIDRQFERVTQVAIFDTRRLLRRMVDRAAGLAQPLEIQVQGPFETSYSLAVVNRKLALGLDRSPDLAVSVYTTEGPGDYRPAPEDLETYPDAAGLFDDRSRAVPRRRGPPDVPAEGDRQHRSHHL